MPRTRRNSHIISWTNPSPVQQGCSARMLAWALLFPVTLYINVARRPRSSLQCSRTSTLVPEGPRRPVPRWLFCTRMLSISSSCETAIRQPTITTQHAGLDVLGTATSARMVRPQVARSEATGSAGHMASLAAISRCVAACSGISERHCPGVCLYRGLTPSQWSFRCTGTSCRASLSDVQSL
jgi:hypothetical protein